MVSMWSASSRTTPFQLEPARTQTYCPFFIDPVMKEHRPNEWVAKLTSARLAEGLPVAPLRNYNMLAMGFDWGKMEYPESVYAEVPEGVDMPDSLGPTIRSPHSQ